MKGAWLKVGTRKTFYDWPWISFDRLTVHNDDRVPVAVSPLLFFV